MLSGLELFQLDEADAQQVVEQVAAQALGDAFADVGAQVVVCSVQAGAENGHNYHADEQEPNKPYVCGWYRGVYEKLEEEGLDQPHSRTDKREGEEDRYPGNLASQFLLQKGEGGLGYFGTGWRAHAILPRSAVGGDRRSRCRFLSLGHKCTCGT